MVILDVAIVNVALPFDQVRSRLLADEPAMGDLGLRDSLRRDAAARRPDRRSARAPTAVRRRPGAVRHELAALRPRLVRGVADRLPRAAGARRGIARPRRALAPDDDIRRGPRAQPRARHLRCGFGQRCGGGRLARRPAHVVPQLVLDLLHQCSGGGRGDRADAVSAAREPRGTASSALRLCRRRVNHFRPDAARLRDDPRGERRLGIRHDARVAFGIGRARARVRPDRAALALAAAAAADVPTEDAHGRERSDGDRRGRWHSPSSSS